MERRRLALVHADVDPTHPHAGAKQPATRRLEHGRIDFGMAQHQTRAGPAMGCEEVGDRLRVFTHYGEDEAIELGPDENMHDRMIETMAELSVKRGYILGIGIMSSKVVGINHKQYGVTSTGVVKFAEVAMREQGVDMRVVEKQIMLQILDQLEGALGAAGERHRELEQDHRDRGARWRVGGGVSARR